MVAYVSGVSNDTAHTNRLDATWLSRVLGWIVLDVSMTTLFDESRHDVSTSHQRQVWRSGLSERDAQIQKALGCIRQREEWLADPHLDDHSRGIYEVTLQTWRLHLQDLLGKGDE